MSNSTSVSFSSPNCKSNEQQNAHCYVCLSWILSFRVHFKIFYHIVLYRIVSWLSVHLVEYTYVTCQQKFWEYYLRYSWDGLTIRGHELNCWQLNFQAVTTKQSHSHVCHSFCLRRFDVIVWLQKLQKFHAFDKHEDPLCPCRNFAATYE